MNKKIIFFTAIVALVCCIFFLMPQDLIRKDKSYESPNIIILVWSGVRFKDSFGDSEARFIPRMKNNLVQHGTLYSNMYDASFEFHVPPLASIISGRKIPMYKYGMDRVLPETPTIFQYARKKFKDSATKYWEIGSYGPYTAFHLSEDFGPDTRPAYILSSLFPQPRKKDLLLSPEAINLLDKDEHYFFDETERRWHRDMWDSLTEVNYRFFKKVLKKHQPRIVLFNMTSTDIAHGAHWAKYVAGIRRLDEISYEIWTYICSDPYYKDNTYLFVTPDHERNRFFMQHTESTYENPARVWTYIYGPDIIKGQIIDRQVDHIDICETIAHILQVDATYSKGQVLLDAFLEKETP